MRMPDWKMWAIYGGWSWAVAQFHPGLATFFEAGSNWYIDRMTCPEIQDFIIFDSRWGGTTPDRSGLQLEGSPGLMTPA